MDLLALAREAGLKVRVEGDKLQVVGPRRAEQVALELLRRKPEIVAALRHLDTCAVCGFWPPAQVLADGSARCSEHRLDAPVGDGIATHERAQGAGGERARPWPIRYEDGPWAYPWPPPQDPGRCEDCGRPLPPELPGWKCAACSIRTFEAKGWPVSAWLRALAQREAEGEPAADR
jgi:hypothetical protein